MTYPSEHIASQQVLQGDPHMSVPFGVHIIIFHTIEQLRSACGDNKANASSSTYSKPDKANIGARIMLVKTDLELSLIAHEVAHIALNHHKNITQGRLSARQWLSDHPEHIAEMIGNLTAIIWYNLPAHLTAETASEGD